MNNSKKNSALWHRKDYARCRAEVISLLGGKCSCGFSDIRALQVDHVNGGGSSIKRPGNAYKIMLKDIQNGSKDYQLLCANCNWIKKAERNENVQRKYE